MVKKVGIEAQRIFREKKHGMDMVALETIRSLQKIDPPGYEFYVFVKPGPDRCLQSGGCVKVIELRATTYPWWEQVVLPVAVKKYGLQLLHSTSNTAPTGVEPPLLITLHDIIYLENKSAGGGSWYQKLGNIYRRWNIPKVVPKAAALITVSEAEKKCILNHFRTNKEVHVVHNGISERFFNEVPDPDVVRVKQALKLPEAFLFFLGNPDPKKNMSNVLKAFIRILRQGPAELHAVVGDYDEFRLSRLLKEQNAEELQPRFVLPGYIPNSDLPAVYKQAAVFLYPSLRESFGIPILEAQACRTALVTSNTSSMPEIAGKGAVLVNPESPDDIAEATLKLLTDAEFYQTVVQDGRTNAERFSWDQTARATLGIYQRILQ